MSYSRLTLVLTESEMEQLRQAARQNVRRPRDQARYILLSNLGLAVGDQATNSNTVAPIDQIERDRVAV